MTDMPVPSPSGTPADITAPPRDGFLTILMIFLRLGLTSFGGPIAHIGYLREEFVTRRKWMTEQSYADLVALVERAGVSARVRLHGPVKDVSVLLARADAMVISSSHGEALPMAGIEALSAGVPVVTTDVGDCHLLAIEDSLLVPARSPHRIAAALGEVLRGGKEYSRAAKKLASDRFDIDDTVQRYRGVYQRVLAFRRRSTR